MAAPPRPGAATANAWILVIGDPSAELDVLSAALVGGGQRWSVQVVPGEVAAMRELMARQVEVVICGLADSNAAIRVLATARTHAPAAARVLFTQEEGRFGGVLAARVAHQVIVGGWDPATVESVIDRACGGAGLISDARLRALVGSTNQLPSLPASVTHLLRLLDDPDVSMPNVVRVLQREPAMCAKALQLVNSAFFGLPRRISSIDQAALHLGLTSLRTVVLTSEAFGAIRGAPEPVVTSVRSRAILAAQIAREMVGARADDALTAAMLRDVGELLLASRLPVRFGEVQERVLHLGCSTTAAERAVFGVTHAQVGASLLSLWGLPFAVTEAVAFSHTAYPHPGRGLDATAVVFIAGALADEALRVPGAPTLDPEWAEAHGLTDQLPAWRRYAEVVSMTWPAA